MDFVIIYYVRFIVENKTANIFYCLFLFFGVFCVGCWWVVVVFFFCFFFWGGGGC